MTPTRHSRRGSAEALNALFFALADETRRSLLARLRQVDQTAGALASGFAVTRPAVSRHLRVLREAELVCEQRRGRERVYRLVPERLSALDEWLSAYRVFWAARLQDLREVAESLPDEEQRPRSRKSQRRT